MEPVTHILTGACLSRTGLNRHAAYATLAMAISAELPDIDTVWSLRGPVYGFEHHRGITHTFAGIPVEAALVVAAIYGLHRWRIRKAAVPAVSSGSARLTTSAPVRWGILYLFTLLALLSHLLLDFTNNYGIRPFFPFNPHWYAASIVFIFDPLIFALLLAAILLPLLFRLVSSEVGARRQPFVARGWSIAALLCIVGLWTLRETQHERVLQLALAQSLQAPVSALTVTDALQGADQQTAPVEPTPIYLQAQRVLASPDPLSPFRWYTVTDFGPLYQLGLADSRAGTLVPNQVTQPKLNPSPALRAAQASPLGRAFLDWSSMPFVTITSGSGAAGIDELGEPLAAGHTIVQFADPRFMGDVTLLHTSGRTPLTARVELDENDKLVEQSLDGRVQRP
jgi:inner membrane protein